MTSTINWQPGWFRVAEPEPPWVPQTFDPDRCRCTGDAYSGLIICDYCMEEGPFDYEPRR